MKNVVITGLGINSCIGNSYKDVLESLQNGMSGICFNDTYSEMGFRSCVSGSINIDLSEHIDRKLLRFMGESAGYSYLAALDALEMANLEAKVLDSPRIGIVAGSGGASTRVMVQNGDITREKGPKRIGPYGVTKSMSSSISAILATALKLKGINYSISSACATSAHCIGHAAELIKSGQQDIVIAGGSDDEHWSSSALFDAMKNKDLLEVADALTDILYVTYGAGHAFGIDLDRCFNEVQNSNMSKLDINGKPIYNESGKVMKGPHYFKPDLSKFVN